MAVDPLNTTCRSVTLPEPKADIPRPATGQRTLIRNSTSHSRSRSASSRRARRSRCTTSRRRNSNRTTACRGSFALYATLNNDPKLAEFSFILNWPKLEAGGETRTYSKYASHELSFFLFKKDPEFFQSVVQPYLANKKDKTFMDHFLLEDDLSDYLEPWKYGQLNIVERILLAHRIDGEREHTSRHVSDLYRPAATEHRAVQSSCSTRPCNAALWKSTMLLG